ncbi:MAG TPA: bifunctional UDP-N-acetylglucosamine diphosphorylase/glucosamine-1-phosphate N-acetyltransferase GlmU [Solirubrobacteraceae bacterium]|nr:bifunctional UDP-N-acetylglucosamine diphosphorylase/glucosamine-1-phosphate N-acetyltransferase GlmU [Solirubrobacteraceae bacterium]
MSPAPTVVILAAGEGTRMRSSVPKILHPICGRPMLMWPLLAARGAGATRVVVVDNPQRRLQDHLPEDVEVAVQERPLGTGDAVRAGLAALADGEDGTLLVVNGDMPLITADAFRALLQAHETAGAAATLATMELADPTGYGRVVRAADASVERVVETKVAGDATPEELGIREVNAGLYAFDVRALRDSLGRLEADNAQAELYLPDVVPILRASRAVVQAYRLADPDLALGVNDRVDLAVVTALAQRRIHEAHQRAGVTIVDPASTVIEASVAIGPDTVVEPSTFLRGATCIGARSVVGPATTVIDSVLGDGVTVVHSYLHRATVGDRGNVGPFAYLRPGADLREGAKAGTFVEVKNSTLGPGTKVPHLSYIGDTDIGEKSNIGAGTITANYDGHRKHRTTIGAGVRLSVHTSLVAPVTVGDGAYTGAGSVITEDVPAGALGIARERQRNIEGYAERVAERRGAAR